MQSCTTSLSFASPGWTLCAFSACFFVLSCSGEFKKTDAVECGGELDSLTVSLTRIEEKLDRLSASPRAETASQGRVPEPTKATNDPTAIEFEGLCLSCHRRSGGPDMVAPPVFAVVDHYRKNFDDEEKLRAAVVNYVKSPSVGNSLMPGAHRKFGLMPALPLPDEQLGRLVKYMFDGDYPTPVWYEQHYQQEHGAK